MRQAATVGVQPEYTHANGETIRADPGTVAAVEQELARAHDDAALSPVIVHPGERASLNGTVRTEDGRARSLQAGRPVDLPLGYHRLDGPGGDRQLICSPTRCHLPADLRVGGWALQLHAMRSRRSWGFGDLEDLRTFGTWAARRGAGFALVNPLSASSPVPPVEPSPYLPTSRRWRNPLYLRVEEVPGASALGAELERTARAGRALNEQPLIDRDRVSALKMEALALIHDASPPGKDFARWRREQGEGLRGYATFCAIAEEQGGDWRVWPLELRSPASAAVAQRRRRLAPRVRFHAWVQWLIERQLGAAAAALPLMQDLPIGVHPGGADVWCDRDLFATGFSVGAPPDLFNTRGQDWGQPPFNPLRLRASGYAPLAAILRAALHASTALRIDHVMGLFRLYWIPAGAPPDSGVYVRYPADELLDVLALESVRAQAWVVGEDLGTVEPMVREQMSARDILSYRLVWFEEGPPSALPVRAMSAVTTHDLPTVAGAWTGADLRLQRAIGLEPNEAANEEIRERLATVTGLPDSAAVEEVTERAYRALAGSPSMAVAAALEDAAGVVDRPNVPGTTGESHPNWSVALPAPLEQLLQAPLVGRIGEILRRAPA